MISHVECPLCQSETSQVVWGRNYCEVIPTPQNIQVAGTNVILRRIVKTDALCVSLIRCSQCSHMYLTPTFDELELANLYSKSCVDEMKAEFRISEQTSGQSWNQQHSLSPEQASLQRSAAFAERPMRLASLFRSMSPNEPCKILDIGGGTAI